MGRQIIEHDADQRRLGITDVDQLAHAGGKVPVGAPVGDLDLAPGPMGIEEDQQVNRAVAAEIAIVALRLRAGQAVRAGRDRLADLADQLRRSLVEAHHRSLGIGRLGVEVEHVLHADDVVGVDLSNAPHVLRHGLSSFSARRRRTVSRDRPACPVSPTISPASNSRACPERSRRACPERSSDSPPSAPEPGVAWTLGLRFEHRSVSTVSRTIRPEFFRLVIEPENRALSLLPPLLLLAGVDRRHRNDSLPCRFAYDHSSHWGVGL